MELAQLFERFRYIGGVVDYVVIDPGNNQPSYELHQMAAIFFMEVLNDRFGTSKWCCDYDPDPDIMYADPITVSEFLGPRFNHEKNTIIKPRSRVESGYAYAFSDPPYSLGVSLEEANQLFSAINKHLFDSFSAELEIYQWSTDWSSYFRAGNEWWGSFLWTIYNKRRNFIVAVGASATD